MFALFFFSCLYLGTAATGGDQKACETKPNIIIILADDFGFNDVGFHNSTMFPTPNIDALACNGVILNQFYSSSLCTPSRSALMTGKFPIFTGMQHEVILPSEPWGLPLNLKTLPQYFKNAGYNTHLVGKWHLGFFSHEYTPTYRGFDSFFGYYQGYQDYYTHRSQEMSSGFDGYDVHENFTTYVEPNGIYGTDLYTDRAIDVIQNHDTSKPLLLTLAQIATHASDYDHQFLQAPEEDIDRFQYIEDPNRRIYAAMVSKLDESVGRIVETLNEKDMLENSIILFMADNGAPTIGRYATTGSNYPFRGIKATEFEGGTRLTAALWSPLLKHKQRVSNMVMHMVDVLPTLCAAAGIHIPHTSIDGINMWNTLQKASDKSPRHEFPYNIDPSGPLNSTGAIRVGDWKYYKGNNLTNEYKGYLGDKYGTAYYPGITDNYEIVLDSVTNVAITALIQDSGAEVAALSTEKIKSLKEDAKIKCPPLDKTPLCDPTKECLFNLKQDPCERYNLAELHPQNYQLLKNKFEQYRDRVVAPRNVPGDEWANPDLYGGVWVNWYDYQAISNRNSHLQGMLYRIGNFGSTMSATIRGFFKKRFW